MKTNIYAAGKIIADILGTVTPPDGITCSITHDVPSVLPDCENIFIVRKIPPSHDNSVKYVLCARDPSSIHPETLSYIYDLWPEPLTPSLLRFYFTKLLERLLSEHRNTSESIKHHKRMVEMARQDYLTGLATRWYLQEYITANHDELNVTCIYLDLDNFKTVNDTYGHQAGDRALAATAEMMQQVFTDGFCARMGGDEFMIVLLGERDITDVEERVNSFMAGLLKYYAGTSTMKALSVSAGISQKTHAEDKTIDRLIHESDLALYAAKKSGRSRCKIYSPELEHEDAAPSSQNFYLVDYENVHSAGLDGIHKLDADSRVCIFYSRNASHLTAGINMNIRESRAEITYHHVEAGMKNALDFQLSSYLGELIAENASHNCRYYIVSRDNGFSALVPYWREKGVNVEIIPDISGHDTAKLDDLTRRIEEMTGDAQMSRRLAEIITQSSTKIEINSAIQRLYRNSKAGEVYRIIRPLIENKPGQRRRVL